MPRGTDLPPVLGIVAHELPTVLQPPAHLPASDKIASRCQEWREAHPQSALASRRRGAAPTPTAGCPGLSRRTLNHPLLLRSLVVVAVAVQDSRPMSSTAAAATVSRQRRPGLGHVTTAKS